MKSTHSKITSLKKRIKEYYKAIEEIQKECTHPKKFLEKKNRSDVGNYDPSQDSYWTEFKCNLCEKAWSEDQ